jgi:exodeoxyribonuclease V gamma subunit
MCPGVLVCRVPSCLEAFLNPTPVFSPGLLVLHGNRLEDLAQAALAWQARHPLGPLDEEVVLVQSNGMAEWFKMVTAQAHGVAAALRVELPARFVWRLQRCLLGREAVPAVLPLDKLPLAWRLMAQLTEAPPQAWPPGWAQATTALQRLQLARQVADVFDQYQVYRADWLADWLADAEADSQPAPPAAGTGPAASGSASTPAQRLPPAVPDADAWQPALWRWLLGSLPPAQRAATRPALHARALQRLQQAKPGSLPGLPQRVLLFGSTQLPLQTLELLAALARHCPVILAVPNPCRFHWADLMDGREHFQQARRRQPLRQGRDLSQLPLAAVHAHGHALLAGWGRQARDFVRQLDSFDDVQRSQANFDVPRVDLFDDAPGAHLLQRLQADIRDLRPLAELQASGEPPPVPDDRSIVFQVAHSPMREVEVLHDQLLALLAGPAEPGAADAGPLAPRDIVVMMPDVGRYAPAIRAVFGRLPRSDARHIPWGITDLADRGCDPLLRAVEWLLRIDEHRLAASELRDLLELPATARKLGLQGADLPLAAAWLAQARVCWGLDATQRAALGLAEAGDANTWRFGIRRLLLGYAAGELDDGYAGIEPLAAVSGLSAQVAGALAEAVQVWGDWWADAASARTPLAWAERVRALLAQSFEAETTEERDRLAALDLALAQWLQVCQAAGFEEPVPLAVLREGWLAHLAEPGGAPRFRAGGVTFCTLLPMRAIPFEVVCLLGMNEGDYPRSTTPAAMDLMARPGWARAGDRSRRDDDRQLMLDALLSARRVFSVSWVGRNVRDDSPQPPSVLVAQLREHLDMAYGKGVSDARTTVHPLQPFSRRYFEEPAPAGPTYASEWRRLHLPMQPTAQPAAQPDVQSAAQTAARPAPRDHTATSAPDGNAAAPAAQPLVLTLADLEFWLRNPVRTFFRKRLGAVFPELEDESEGDDERLAAGPLHRSRWLAQLLAAWPGQPLSQGVRRLQRAGELPLGGPGQAVAQALCQTAAPMLAGADALRAQYPQLTQPLPLNLAVTPTVSLQDNQRDLWADASGGASIGFTWLASALAGRETRLVASWLRQLGAAAAGQPVPWVVVASDGVTHLAPPEPDLARQTLTDLALHMATCLQEGRAPATAPRTGVAWLKSPETAAAVYDGQPGRAAAASWPECQDRALARLYPSFAHLQANPSFQPDTLALYGVLLQHLAQRANTQPLPQAQPAITGQPAGAP